MGLFGDVQRLAGVCSELCHPLLRECGCHVCIYGAQLQVKSNKVRASPLAFLASHLCCAESESCLLEHCGE